MAKRSPVAVASGAQPKRSRAAASPRTLPSPGTTTTTATGLCEWQRCDAADLEADSSSSHLSEWRRDCADDRVEDDQQQQQRHLRHLLHRSHQQQQDSSEDTDALATRKVHKQQQQQSPLLTMVAAAAAASAYDGSAGSSRRSRAPVVQANVADRHSCLAAPYSPTDVRTLRYFDLVISKAKAPVVCASAGKLKGKAIFADKDLEQSARIWTETPFVAMQHESNRAHVRCCQYCFVPLLSDYQARWRDMAARWNHRHSTSTEPPVADDELDRALEQLQVNRKNCGLAGAAATCGCGEVYCSKLCQLRAFHEYHAILCPREDAYSAMNQFLTHMRHTNDIFFLVAKVIARLLSRYLQSRDVLKAREPMDMFYKKPWWEVVMMEKQLQHMDNRISSSSDMVVDSSDSVGATAPQQQHKQTPGATLPQSDGLGAYLDDARSARHGDAASDDDGIQAHCLRELLTYTHQLLLDAIECNLVHLARDDHLHGLAVDDIWTSCASILSFEFFAAQLGLFEMNNVSMEIDHPFRGLIEILDPDVHAETDDDDDLEARSDAADSVVSRVRRVLEHEEALLTAQQQQQQQQTTPSSPRPAASASSSARPSGFLGVEGTALFPIICTMNHSCDPNCTVLYTKDGHAHVVAVRDIKKGDELCICYIDIDDDVHTREANLREYQFKCFCARCSDERQALTLAHHSGTSYEATTRVR